MELLHAEMGGGMVLEVEAFQSPERNYMSPEEFHEPGKDADIWLGATPIRPLDDVAIFTEEVKAVVAFRNQEFYSSRAVLPVGSTRPTCSPTSSPRPFSPSRGLGIAASGQA